MKKTLILAIAGITVLLAGCTYQVSVDEITDEPSAQVDEEAGWATFTNPTGEYSFEYPSDWNAEINQYDNDNSLFGAGATTSSSAGGVEITEYSDTLDAYLTYMEENAEVDYISPQDITINGVSGVRTSYEGFPVSGDSVILKDGDRVFNIFINSDVAADIALFDQLAASFTLL